MPSERGASSVRLKQVMTLVRASTPLYRDGLCWHTVSSLTGRSAFARCLSRCFKCDRQTVLSIRRKLQTSALPDAEVETDEMFQNAGEKGDKHVDVRIRRVGVAINWDL